MMKALKFTVAMSALALAFGTPMALAQETSAAPPAAEAAPAAPADAAAPAPTPVAVDATAAAAVATPAAPAEALPPVTTANGGIAAPPAGKGQIVFFRPSRMGGAALSFSIREGNTGIGKLGNGSYFVHIAEPGPHEYTNQSEAKDTLRLEIEPGETYWVEQSIGMGIVMGRPHLTPSAKETFEAKKMKLSTKVATDLKD
jgi:hypothetical protein